MCSACQVGSRGITSKKLSRIRASRLFICALSVGEFSDATSAQENGEDQEVSNINQRFHRALVASLNSPTLNAQ